MNLISAKEFKNLLKDESKKIDVIDVRTTEEWDSGHIKDPRVRNIEINKLLSNTDLINKNINTYLICESGGRSSYGQLILKTKGISVIEVGGGMSEYRKLK